MESEQREKIIQTITEREALRPLSKLERLKRDPIRAFPYYILAALGHIKPYPLTFKTLWDTKMTCYLPEGNTFYYYGYCEANLTNFILRYLKPGSTFIDVGAHVGFYSMLSSALVGTSGQVHSFEPTPWTFGLLTKNTRGLSNVTLNNKAVSDKKGMTSFLDYGPGYGAYNSAHPKGAVAFISKKGTEVNVETLTLDDYCKERNILPDFIKLDAEGLEHIILQGMTSLLSGNNRPIVTLEAAGGKEWAENMKASLEFLFSKDYKVYEMAIDGTIKPHMIRESYEYENLLFIPSERETELANLYDHH